MFLLSAVENLASDLIVRNNASDDIPECRRVIGHQEMCEFVDHNVFNETSVLFGKPRAEFKDSPFAEAFSPERTEMSYDDL